jgi:starvation-inducible DNA-binding protein
MTLKQALTQVFGTNFMAYLHSHIAHVNIVGRNFESDHALLKGIYEDLQDQIDVLGELLRTIRAFMPQGLDKIVSVSQIANHAVTGDAEELLMHVYDDIEVLIADYKQLVIVADQAGSVEIGNFAQDRLLAHQKHCWMLRATLQGRIDSMDSDDDEDYPEDEELF